MNILPTETTHYYIGPDDCAKATCNRKQEFPDGPSNHCFLCGLEVFANES